MNISAFFRRAVPQQQLRIPRVRLSANRSLPTSAQSSTMVQISGPASKAVHPTASSPKSAALREFLSKYDFSSITPRQMAQVGGHLFEQKEISENAAASFIGVELNLVQERDPDMPIDMNKHFQHMMDAVTGAVVTLPGEYDFAIKYRQEASKALSDIMSFVKDDRSHVST